MSNVIQITGQIPPNDGTPNEAVIDALECLLASAKDGKIQSFVLTGFTDDGMRLGAYGGRHDNIYAMLGAIHWLADEYIQREKDGS
jgi:hypothetical protein